MVAICWSQDVMNLHTDQHYSVSDCTHWPESFILMFSVPPLPLYQGFYACKRAHKLHISTKLLAETLAYSFEQICGVKSNPPFTIAVAGTRPHDLCGLYLCLTPGVVLVPPAKVHPSNQAIDRQGAALHWLSTVCYSTTPLPHPPTPWWVTFWRCNEHYFNQRGSHSIAAHAGPSHAIRLS